MVPVDLPPVRRNTVTSRMNTRARSKTRVNRFWRKTENGCASAVLQRTPASESHRTNCACCLRQRELFGCAMIFTSRHNEHFGRSEVNYRGTRKGHHKIQRITDCNEQWRI
ncbi:hypothetical protein AVEN_185688-1 [Araneus ventricosus]|uniref:Uncharacterized protein n=1 Tax=Araneus ventricosus TaxID=182803 RepID=A0A4Y2WTF6_ARAVE|nr:hypothetical protein AVEN_185688-1 [Araneus ventricosus]